MAFVKACTLTNGLEAPNAYHIVLKVDTVKRAFDDPDPNGARPDNAPEYIWKAGYYGRILVATYASKEARDTGKTPILMTGVYPTDAPYMFYGEFITDLNLNFAIDINSTKSAVDQAYDHLKTLPAWADAKEV